jgi:hypothetical protein
LLTLELLLCIGSDQPSGSLDGPLAEEARRLMAAMPAGSRMRFGHSLRHHRDAAIRAGVSLERLDDFVDSGLVPSSTAVPIASFDSVLELTVPDDAGADRLIDQLEGLVDRMGPSVDPSRSAAVVGADHAIFGQGGAVQFFCCLYRSPALSPAEFSDRWLNQLVEHTGKTPGKTAYRQVHADPQLTVRAAKAIGVWIDDIDGVALEWYPDVAKLWAASDWANQPGAPIVQAELQLIDFSRARSILVYGPDEL